jgi:hypothetical protein
MPSKSSYFCDGSIRNSASRMALVTMTTAAQLAMASDGVHSVSLDEAIAAMRMTAAGELSIKNLVVRCGKQKENVQFFFSPIRYE